MPQVINSALGLEEIFDVIALVIIEDINPALEKVYERRFDLDKTMAEAKGIDFEPIDYEEVPSDHIHVGNFPSLVFDSVPVKEYPYIALTLEDYSPDPEDALQDHMNVFRDGIVVHCLSVASELEGPEIVFRRSCRMAEAVFIALASNNQTQRMLSGLSNPVRGRPSIPWRYQFEGYGDNYWFQAIGTQYQIKSYTTVNN
jgi:hypothetical protein